MRAINHALTGAIIGLVINEPLVAAPLAVASHFVCDAIPHHDGVPAKPSLQMKQKWHKSRWFKRLLYLDVILCLSLVIVLAVRGPKDWLLAAVCAFLAASPDFLWLPRYLKRHQKPTSLKGFSQFASRIQWFQRPIGAVVEVAWFISGLILLAPLLG